MKALDEAEDRLDALLDALLTEERAPDLGEIRATWGQIRELRALPGQGGVRVDASGLHIETDVDGFAVYLRERRRCLGLSLRTFAARIGLSKSHLSNLEHGVADQIELPTLLRLAWGLQEPPLALVRRIFPGVRWSVPAGGFLPPALPLPRLPPARRPQ